MTPPNEIEALALDQRSGLPDALRVLLEAYPRQGWSEDPGFNEVIRFWLERHLMFRRLTEVLGEEARSRLDGKIDARRHAAGLARYGGMFVNELHMHHQVEDHHYFPVLAQRDSRLARGFEILDRDHHAMDAILSGFASAANGVLSADLDSPQQFDAVGGFLEERDRVAALLERHLTDEEELVVPIILKYGTLGLH